MLSIILFILIISAFAVMACFRFDRAFEEALPISSMGIILTLFLFGMINILQVGAIVICALAFFMYVYTIWHIVKHHDAESIKKGLLNLITPGSVVFAVFAGLLAYWNKGRLAMTTDEFSHWLDTVVIMARIDDFGTASNSTAVFPSYPPAMSLFQYLLEKVNMACTGGFSEWKTYYAYQLLVVIVMLPFIKVKENGIVRKIAGIILWLVALIAPLYFFKDMYGSLYIDPFLGIMGGCGFAAIALRRNKDLFYEIYITMLCATLVLAKDVGIYLAMFIGLYYVIDYVSVKQVDNKLKKLLGLCPIAAMLVAKMLWKLELSVSHTHQKFSAPFDVKGTIATIQGHGSEFYTSVYNAFREAITYRYIYYERLGFNYVSIMTLMTVAFILFNHRLYRNGRVGKATAIAGAIIPSATVIFYILSLFPLYVSRFSEEEASYLASFDRYCGIVFLTGLLYGIWLLRDAICSMSSKVLMIIISVLFVASVLHSKADTLKAYTSRQTVEVSKEYRSLINILSDKINRNTEEDCSILLVGDDADVPYHPILATISKPRSITFSDIYISSAVDESGISLNDFKELLASNYDYVAIYRVTENLDKTYSDVFVNKEDIRSLSLYLVDKATGMLKLVE